MVWRKIDARTQVKKYKYLSEYHAIVVTVDHDGATAPQVDVFLPPVANLEPNHYKLYLT